MTATTGQRQRQSLTELVKAGQAVGMSQAELLYFIATSYVESGWDYLSVGDHGSSFGLFQHHVGGAGGSTLQSARRYLNPTTSATERAQTFHKAHVSSGAGAAGVQRPANQAAYARQVDATARAIESGTFAPLKAATGGGAGSSSRTKWSPQRDAVRALAAQMGLQHTDGDRSPNAGYGASNSAHRTDRPEVWADDYSSSDPAKMDRFAAEVRRRFPGLTVLGRGHQPQTGPNVHVQGSTSGSGGGTTAVSWVGDVAGLIPGFGPVLKGVDGAVGAADNLAGGAATDGITAAAKWFGENLIFVVIVAIALLTAAALTGVGLFRATGSSPKRAAGLALAPETGGASLAAAAAKK